MVILTGCSKKTKSFFGLNKTTPDEFTVVQNQPLTVPPMFVLQDPNVIQALNKKDKKSTDTTLSQEDKKFMKQLNSSATNATIKKDEKKALDKAKTADEILQTQEFVVKAKQKATSPIASNLTAKYD